MASTSHEHCNSKRKSSSNLTMDEVFDMVNNEENGESGDDDDESDLDFADFAHSSEESDDNNEVAGEIFGETNAGEPINSTSVLSNEWITIANLELDREKSISCLLEFPLMKASWDSREGTLW